MKKFLKQIGYIFLIPLVVITILLFPVYESDAATLGAGYVTLTRIKQNLTGATGQTVEMYIAIETTAAFTTGSGTLTISFPDDGSNDDGDWCRTAGSDLVVAGVTSSPADIASNATYDIDAALPTATTLSATCAQGSGAGSVDTIVISNISTLLAGNTYGVKVSNGSTAKLGTSGAGSQILTLEMKDTSNTESMSFGVYLVTDDQVVVSATVLEVATVNCTISTASVPLGDLYRGGSYITGSHTISTGTSGAAEGYYWAAYGEGDGSTDAGLHLSGSTVGFIPSTGSTTIDLRVADSKGFGMTASQPSGATVPANFSSATAGVFGALDRTAAGARLFLYQVGAQGSAEQATITYGARANSANTAGAYTETVTFICGGYY